jgi:hypothetical protein
VPGRTSNVQTTNQPDLTSPAAILTLQRTLGNKAANNLIQAYKEDTGAHPAHAMNGPKPLTINGKLPRGQISRKKTTKRLDFVRMKRKKIKWGRILLPASMQSKKKRGSERKRDAEGGNYGHWWTEIGDLDGDKWKPRESYGWWPDVEPNIKQTLKGVKGVLNDGGEYDPHHGENDAATEFHPAAQVDDTESYEDVRDRILADIRTFAKGYSGKWSWIFGWGQNCHTFQTKMMDKAGLKKKKAKRWLMRPAETLSMKEHKRISDLKDDNLLGPQATELLQNGADIKTVANAVPDFLTNVSKLAHKYIEAIWRLMNITEAELKRQLIEQRITFHEDVAKYPEGIEQRQLKAGTKLLAATDFDGPLEDITITDDTKFKVMVRKIYVMLNGRCNIRGGGQDLWVPVRLIFGDR